MVIVAITNAQDYTDAIRYSERFNLGDARYSAMGGAFSALGNNHSAILDNPASIGVFGGNSYEFSLNNGIISSSTNYLNTNQKNNYGLFNANVGLLFKVELPENEMKAKYLNFSYTCNQVNNFNNAIGFNAYNNSSSLTDELLRNFENNPNALTSVANDAWKTYLINQDANNNYYSDFITKTSNGTYIRGSYGIDQIQKLTTSGRVNQNSYGFGTNILNKVYLGGTFNVSNLMYSEHEVYSENNSNNSNTSFNSFTSDRTITDRGKGYGYKIGVIGIPVKNVRLAVSYHSPTFWQINREYQTQMQFSFTDSNKQYTNSTNNNPDNFKYKLFTPSKLVVGLAYTFKKTLILSADYEFMKYSNAIVSSTDSYSYDYVNKDITSFARIINNLKFGAEMKYGPLSFRGGAAFYQSPDNFYKDGFTDYRVSYSGGIGLKDENFYIDLALVNTTFPSFRYIYTDYDGNTLYSKTKSTVTNVVLTLGLKY